MALQIVVAVVLVQEKMLEHQPDESADTARDSGLKVLDWREASSDVEDWLAEKTEAAQTRSTVPRLNWWSDLDLVAATKNSWFNSL